MLGLYLKSLCRHSMGILLYHGLPVRAVADSPLRSKKVTSITSADTEKYLQGLCIDIKISINGCV